MPERCEIVDELRVSIRNRDFLALSRLLQGIEPFGAGPRNLDAQTLGHRTLLLEELEIQIEDLKNEAVRMFDREQFLDCLETFEFLCKVNPKDRSFKDYLELCKQCVQEKLAPSEATAAPDEAGVNTKEAKGSNCLAVKAETSETTDLTKKMRICFDRRDFAALKDVVKEALTKDTKRSGWDKDRRLEEAQLKVEFETHVHNLKTKRSNSSRAELTVNASELFDSCVSWNRTTVILGATWKLVSNLLRVWVSTESELTGRTPQLVDTQGEDHGVSENFAPLKPAPSRSEGNDFVTIAGSEKPRVMIDDDDILEIPGYESDVPSRKTLGSKDHAGAKFGLSLASFRFLPLLGAVCLLVWLVISPGSKLSNSGDTSDGALGSDVLWIEKAESAMAHRRYINPAEDNVIFYCGKVLARDPLNAKAIELKKESLKQATKQAQEFIDKRRYANARELYQRCFSFPRKKG